MNKFVEDFQENGFALVKGVLTGKENENFRKIVEEYFADHPSLKFSGGRCLGGYTNITPELKELNTFHEDKKMLDIAKAILGEGFIFAGHSDLHQDKTTDWHRDILMGPYKIYQQRDLWDDDYKIIKIAFLLQDHSDNDYGLWVVPKSHNRRDDDPSVRAEGEYCVHSEVGDAIVFDQRILHRGQLLSQYVEEYNQSRYLITFGYGLDNTHTAEHARGTAARQQDQRRNLTYKNG
jgi:hypothetical protein